MKLGVCSKIEKWYKITCSSYYVSREWINRVYKIIFILRQPSSGLFSKWTDYQFVMITMD